MCTKKIMEKAKTRIHGSVYRGIPESLLPEYPVG
jgi:hypothetical protein